MITTDQHRTSATSLVFDFEEDGGRPTRSSCGGYACPPTTKAKQQYAVMAEKIAYFSTPSCQFAGKLLRDVRYFERDEPGLDAILLATRLSAVGYDVSVRNALGGGGGSCFRSLRHEFIAVMGSGDFAGVEFILDPDFREHFLIPHPTNEYRELLSHAPKVFVGTSARLVPLVQMLCDAMADSFEAQGLTLPPWRRTAAMLSKWLPARVRTTNFSRASAPPALDPGPPRTPPMDTAAYLQLHNPQLHPCPPAAVAYPSARGSIAAGVGAEANVAEAAARTAAVPHGGVLAPLSEHGLAQGTRSDSPYSRISDPLHAATVATGARQQQQQHVMVQVPAQGLANGASPLHKHGSPQVPLEQQQQQSPQKEGEGRANARPAIQRQDSGYLACTFVPFGGVIYASDKEDDDDEESEVGKGHGASSPPQVPATLAPATHASYGQRQQQREVKQQGCQGVRADPAMVAGRCPGQHVEQHAGECGMADHEAAERRVHGRAGPSVATAAAVGGRAVGAAAPVGQPLSRGTPNGEQRQQPVLAAATSAQTGGGLLAARLQEERQGGQQGHERPRGVETRAAGRWGELPIHTVRFGGVGAALQRS